MRAVLVMIGDVFGKEPLQVPGGLGVSIVPRVAFSTTSSGVTLVPMFPRIRRELGFAVKEPEESIPAVAAFAERLRELSRTRALRRLR